ncbi:MAG: DNA polymerase-3 subunit beta [Candidatus Midichloriaceae bacterium]|jgi:DNA polymerase-3 subunit beta
MILKIKNADLQKALGNIQSIVEKRSATAILMNVKIHTKKNHVSFYTSDLDIFAQEISEAKVAGELITTTTMQILYDVSRKIAESEIIECIFEPSDKPTKLLIKSGSSEFTLPCLSADTFPDFEEGEYDCKFEVNADDIYNILSTVKHAISFDDSRYYLNGIFLHATENNGKRVLRAVATDIHRLAMHEIDLPKGAENIPDIIIPKKTVYEFVKLLENYKDNVSISVSKNKIRFKIGSTILISKLIDGNFPDYNRAIPKNNPKVIKISVQELEKAINLVTTISTEKVKSIKIKLLKNKITLFASDKINSSGTIDVPANYDGEELSVAFNSKYLLDILANTSDQNVTMYFDKSDSAIFINDDSDKKYNFVLMPIAIQF